MLMYGEPYTSLTCSLSLSVIAPVLKMLKIYIAIINISKIIVGVNVVGWVMI